MSRRAKSTAPSKAGLWLAMVSGCLAGGYAGLWTYLRQSSGDLHGNAWAAAAWTGILLFIGQPIVLILSITTAVIAMLTQVAVMLGERSRRWKKALPDLIFVVTLTVSTNAWMLSIIIPFQAKLAADDRTRRLHFQAQSDAQMSVDLALRFCHEQATQNGGHYPNNLDGLPLWPLVRETSGPHDFTGMRNFGRGVIESTDLHLPAGQGREPDGAVIVLSKTVSNSADQIIGVFDGLGKSHSFVITGTGWSYFASGNNKTRQKVGLPSIEE